jgi:hypothetical protein
MAVYVFNLICHSRKQFCFREVAMKEVKPLPNHVHLLNPDCIRLINLKVLCKSKVKAVPLHAMEAHGGRGGIAPTHT